MTNEQAYECSICKIKADRALICNRKDCPGRGWRAQADGPEYKP